MPKRETWRWARLASRSPEGLLLRAFGAAIVAGTLLLCLPWCHHGRVSPLDALFTATSAVCVTGLIVVDTGSAYTVPGQIVILLLIQTGGLGIMSFAGLTMHIMRQRLSLRARAALSGSLWQHDVTVDLKAIVLRILRFVLLAEGMGAVLLFIALAPSKGAGHAGYSAVFHSISAFCNAGFSLYADSLMGLQDSLLVIATVMVLIILGGIGHPVVIDVWRRYWPTRASDNSRPRRLALNSLVALSASGILVVGGAALLLVGGLPAEQSPWSARLWGALFQAVTARTAGFNTVDIGALPAASLFLLILLMFIGGSSGSCAGGIKTSTAALWLAKLSNRLRGEKWPRLFGRHIPGEISRRASMIVGLAVLWNLLGILILLVTEQHTQGAGMRDVVFEQISAFGTVGLSTGLTPHLTTAGRLWIIATMYVGRLGPLTLALWITSPRVPGIRYPEGRIMIG